MGTHPIFESDFDCLTDGLIDNPDPLVKSKSDSRRLDHLVAF